MGIAFLVIKILDLEINNNEAMPNKLKKRM